MVTTKWSNPNPFIHIHTHKNKNDSLASKQNLYIYIGDGGVCGEYMSKLENVSKELC